MDRTDFMVNRAQHMRPLEYDLSNRYNELVRYLDDAGVLSNIPVGSIGPSEIITASDALSAPLRSLVVGGNSVQDGTPTPAAPVDIVSVENPVLHFSGKNFALVDETYIRRPSWYMGEWTGTTLIGENGLRNVRPASFGGFGGFYINNLPAGTYTFSAHVIDINAGSCSIHVSSYDGSAMTIIVPNLPMVMNDDMAKYTFTIPSGSKAVAIRPTVFSFRTGYTYVDFDNIQLELGSTATTYEPYKGNTVTLPVTLRSLPDGTRDTLTLTYLRPSTRDGWAWYSGELTRKTGQTTQAATDGITGTVGVDVMSTTGEIADGPTVVYKLATPTAETLDQIELPSVFGPSFTIWGTADVTPTLTTGYVRDISAAINDMQEAIADL